VYTHGGRRDAGLDMLKWARQVEDLGAGEILLTSMDADGTKDGYDIPMTRAVAEAVDIPVIASGGCGSPRHMLDVLKQTKAEAALAASIFHYGQWTVRDVKTYLRENGVEVR
jgi:cyclase